MFERYTEQARRALFFARYEAFQLGSPYIETEHLLLALFREHDSLTARVFARARLSLEVIRRQVEARTSRHARVSEASEVPFSTEAKRALDYAAQEGERLLHNHIGTEHLLLGLFREEHGMAASILNDLGLRLAAVRDQIVEMGSTASVPPLGFPPGLPLPSGDARLLRVSPSRREAHKGPLVVSSPQRVNAEGFTLKELIAWAYRADVRHVDLPAELDARARYDARLDLVGPHSWPAIDRLVQQGINRHFAIEVTHETKLLDVLVLTAVDRPSPGRRRHDEEPHAGIGAMYVNFSTVDVSATTEPPSSEGQDWHDRLRSIGPISLSAVAMQDFGTWLEEFVGHPVIDETGLEGTYDIEVQGEMQGLGELRQALMEQLALVLTKAQREVSVLSVYRVS
jgi:uncharacterized protein (TIGR03435 family)